MSDVIGDLLRSIRKFGMETVFRRYYSVYKGQVSSVDDEQNRGRVLLRVPELFGDRDLANFAEPIVCSGKPGADVIGGKNFMGPFNPPKVGDWVWVEFQKGHQDFPLYRDRGWPADDELPDVFDEASEWNMMNPLFLSRFGHQIYVDESSGKAKFVVKMKNGNSFIIDETSGAEKIEIKSERGAFIRMTLNPDGANTDLKYVIGGTLTETIGQSVSKTYSGAVTEVHTGKSELNCAGDRLEFANGTRTSIITKDDIATVIGKINYQSIGEMKLESAGGEAILAGAIKQKLGVGGHPVPYGDVLKTALDTFFDTLAQGILPGAPPNNAQSLAAIKVAAVAAKASIALMNSIKTETD